MNSLVKTSYKEDKLHKKPKLNDSIQNHELEAISSPNITFDGYDAEFEKRKTFIEAQYGKQRSM